MMENFKSQFLDIMTTDVPAEVVEEFELDEWLYWKKSQLEKWNLSPSQIHFLTEIGLPKTSNEINFEFNDNKTISLILQNHDLVKTYFPLGFDGCGSIVFLNIADNCIYLCDHDNGNEMLFINSSLEKLAETLVFVANVFVKKSIANPLAELSQIDEKAVQENTF